MTDELNAREARQIALAAQGFGSRSRARASLASRARIVEAVERLGVLQLDSVNVLCRAHYLPIFARLGQYDRDVLDASAWERPSALFEYWGHQASLLPVSSHRLFRWRMERAANGVDTWGRIARFGREKHAYIAKVLAEITERGPVAASELSTARRGPGGWWEWSEAKHAVEWLFWAGRVTASSRRHFERLYDLPERVLPRDVLDAKTPDEATAHRELLSISARALGIATEDDLSDYFRLARKDVRPRLAELVEKGELVPARVEGWNKPAYRHSDISLPRRMRATALLAPFDPVIWHRPRALRVFGFHYRIGIYTPAHARTHGYYVLPFLLDDSLVARVDLKADRPRRVLSVRASHVEEGVDPEHVIAPLAEELGRLASWLGLERIEVARKGPLASRLRAVAHSSR